jgi:hypothetical protein
MKFPVEALGSILGPAASSIARSVQASESVVAQSLLAATALAAQGLADVALDGRMYPISNFFVTIAPSGERKSVVNKIAFADVREYEKELQEKYADDLQESDPMSPKSIHSIRKSTIIWEDVSLDGIANSLADGYVSIGIIADEGGAFMGGLAMQQENLMRTISNLSSIHTDGEIKPSIRAHGGRPGREGIRLTLYLMLQPLLAEKLFGNKLLWDQGLLSRFLCVQAASMAGSRTYQPFNVEDEPEVKTYHQRIRELLHIELPIKKDSRGGLSPPTLMLSRKAERKWGEFFNAIENEIATGGRLEKIPGMAAKAGEQALRLAAVLTLISNPRAGNIQSQTVLSACRLMRYYLMQARTLYLASAPDVEISEAIELQAWLWKKKKTQITVADVYQFGPPKFRKAARVHARMQVLVEHGWARERPDRGATCYEIRPMDR